MSKIDIKARMTHLCENLGARLVLSEYLKDRLEQRQKDLMQCTIATFEAHKGRCLELDDLIKTIEGRKE